MRTFLCLIVAVFFSFSLRGQEQVSNITYKNNAFLYEKPFYTEDIYWFNVTTSDGNTHILASDGTNQNTKFFNFDGLNILPQRVFDVVKFENHYYLLVNDGSRDFIIRTKFVDGKWKSEIIERLMYFANDDIFRISSKRLFFVQKHLLRVLEIKGIQTEEIFYRDSSNFAGTLRDFLVLSDNTQIFFFYDFQKGGLAVQISKKRKQSEIFLPNENLRGVISFSEPCTRKYKIFLNKDIVTIYTGTSFYQLNIDLLTYSEPLKGLYSYLSDIFETEQSVYLVGNGLSNQPSKLIQYLKSGEKISETGLAISNISKIIAVDEENILFGQYCTFNPRIIIYNRQTQTDVRTSLYKDFSLNGKVYFSGYESGNAVYENGKVSKLRNYVGNFDGIYPLAHNDSVFALQVYNDSLFVSENPFSENPIYEKKSISALLSQSGLVNSKINAQSYLLTTDGKYQNGQNQDGQKLDYFDGKKKSLVKYENGKLVNSLSLGKIINFKNQYFIINNDGLFALKDDLATKIIRNNDVNFEPYFLSSINNSLIFGLYGESKQDLWISDGTPKNTKLINAPNLILSKIIGTFQRKLYYVKSNYQLYSFDEEIEKFVGNLGVFNFNTNDWSNSESIFYFFNRGDEGIEVSKLNTNGQIEQMFTLNQYKGVRNMNISKIISPNLFQISNYENRTTQLLKIDVSTNQYQTIGIDSAYYANIPNLSIPNESKYLYLQKQLINWTDRDLRDVSVNRVVKFSKDKQLKSVFQFNSKQPNYESTQLKTLNDKMLVVMGAGRNIWQIDTTTDIATQFIYEKDNLRFNKIIDGKLYLNLCKDGQCHLYRTDGSNKNTLQLTQTPLVVQDMFVLNNELYLHASNTKVGFQIWKIRKDDERKVENLFTEKIEPTPSLNFVILSNEEEENTEIIVYPNPFAEKVHLLMDESSFEGIEAYDTKGILLFASNLYFDESMQRLNDFLEHTSTRILYLKVKTNKGMKVKKVIKF